MLKCQNLRNPYLAFYVSQETASFKEEEGGDDARSVWPLCPGLYTWYNGCYSGLRSSNAEPIPKKQPQFGSRSETRPREAGIASNRESAMSR